MRVLLNQYLAQLPAQSVPVTVWYEARTLAPAVRSRGKLRTIQPLNRGPSLRIGAGAPAGRGRNGTARRLALGAMLYHSGSFSTQASFSTAFLAQFMIDSSTMLLINVRSCLPILDPNKSLRG